MDCKPRASISWECRETLQRALLRCSRLRRMGSSRCISGRAAALAARPLHVAAVAYSRHFREHGLRNHDAERIERQNAKTP